ncbi:flagellar basal body rod protein FlgB [Nocardioides sp. YIM 152315]|uniref:flagellar basal body rod protein FlgB n=1 Tax=Nocardioides sp. YIM 152315 TaxID=3031760 RepID=UPI0023DB15AF|nr:flagellar basal body rod protein FlgB [Nocardioides sp. YIM 152315]MDF1605959.1 flagellar basal body rod protein FlgB [Nocardioides sp. YIM 152315]
MSFLSDPVGAILGSALDGISLRQRVIADNIANVDTPHYRASSVDFETNLRSAIGSGATSAGELTLAPTLAATDTPVGANDNNVDLRKETLAAVQSQFQYQMITRATSDRFDLIKTVAAS